LLARLNQSQSPERLRLLEALIRAEETGQNALSIQMLVMLQLYCLGSDIPASLRKRYLSIVVEKAKKVAQSASGDAEGFFDLLSQ
jgi:hypothetical protein